MAPYRIIWRIDLDADDPQAAAREALAIQRDPDSLATVFEVHDASGQNQEIDLLAANSTAL